MKSLHEIVKGKLQFLIEVVFRATAVLIYDTPANQYNRPQNFEGQLKHGTQYISILSLWITMISIKKNSEEWVASLKCIHLEPSDS